MNILVVILKERQLVFILYYFYFQKENINHSF